MSGTHAATKQQELAVDFTQFQKMKRCEYLPLLINQNRQYNFGPS